VKPEVADAALEPFRGMTAAVLRREVARFTHSVDETVQLIESRVQRAFAA
jgi:hypothetical protein